MKDPVNVGVTVFAAIGVGGLLAAILGDAIGHALGSPLLARGSAPVETFFGIGIVAGIAAAIWALYRK